MIEPRKRAYLEAMGFDVWVAKPPEPQRDRLVVGPGQGSTLLVCASPEQCATRLGGDIVRAVGGDPVWAWPDPEGNPDGPRIADAVKDSLFTQVFIFGSETAGLLFGQDAPATIVSAAVEVVADIGELETRGTAKQQFWTSMKRVSARR